MSSLRVCTEDLNFVLDNRENDLKTPPSPSYTQARKFVKKQQQQKQARPYVLFQPSL